MAWIPFSGVRKIFELSNQLEQAGRDVVHLEIGRPDFDTPEHIKNAAVAALQSGHVHYTSNFGILPLRQAIARKLRQDNQLDYKENEIIVTAGVSEAIMMTMMALLNPGDEVLLLDPVFPAYTAAIRMAGAVPVIVNLCEENACQPGIQDLEAKWSHRTRMLIIANPGNPSGVIMNDAALSAICEFAVQKDIWVLSDEIYEKIVYDDKRITSIASFQDMRNRTITVNGFSKTYSMTGWRIGYVAATSEIISALIRVHQFTVVCATTFAQWGALAALESSQLCVAEMLNHYAQRRRLVLDALERIPDLQFVYPDGAFYVYINTSSIVVGAHDFASFLLDRYGVAVVPWDDWHIRIAYTTNIANLGKAMNRLIDAFSIVSKYSNNLNK